MEIKFGIAGLWSKKLAIECERAGYDALYVSDHLTGGLECWTRLSALALITSKIRLGTIVLCNSLRPPGLLANMAATLDVISGGRLVFGIGSGWLKIDYDTCGIPFPKYRVRIEQLEESVKIIKKMWTEDKPTFKGKYYWIKEARCPKPIQKPHPPIMIGGAGEKFLLKVVAKHADNYNMNWMSVEQCKRKMDVLKRHCRKVGRDFDEVEKSWFGEVMVSNERKDLRRDAEQMLASTHNLIKDIDDLKARWLVGTPEECIRRIKEYVDAGITHFILSFRREQYLKLFTEEVLPKIQD